MQQYEGEYRPDPKKISVKGGVIFNPWVNISTCVIATIGLAWLTLWFLSLYIDVTESAPYPDQPLDAVAGMIGVVVVGLVTLILAGCTIFVSVWWARRIRRDRAQQDDADGRP